jgi:hypothetical protein
MAPPARRPPRPPAPGGPAGLHRQAHHPDPPQRPDRAQSDPRGPPRPQGAKIVRQTTTRIRPDQGHVHLLVDGKLVAMSYGLNEQLPKLGPGQHLVQVEFVAADHAPFDPRVLAQAAFIIRP